MPAARVETLDAVGDATEAVARIEGLARAATPVHGSTVVVAVDGRSGAGKSDLASALAARLGCPVVRLDHLYPGWDGLEAGVRLLAAHVLEPLARDERASVPTWSWVRDRPGPVRPVPAASVLIVEGCGALTGAARAHAAVAVWVDAPDDVRRERALARDGETYAPHWDRWAAQEDLVYAAERPWERADVLVRTAAP